MACLSNRSRIEAGSNAIDRFNPRRMDTSNEGWRNRQTQCRFLKDSAAARSLTEQIAKSWGQQGKFFLAAKTATPRKKIT
jgi:hypothetical protein